MRVVLAIVLALLSGCSAKKDALPVQPIAPVEGSLKQVAQAVDNRAGKVAAAVTVARDNADKPEVVRAETGVALSNLPTPTPDDLLVAKARASRADQKDYKDAEAAGKKAMAALNEAITKSMADQAEAKRVSDLKDARIKELTAEVSRIKQEASNDIWTMTGAALAVIGALMTAFMGPKVGIPMLLCGAFCGAVPFIVDSPYFEYIAGGTLVISCGLGLWWLADKVRDSVNEPPNDEETPKE